MVKPVIVNGLTPNSDGLYRLSDLDVRFAEAMNEYDAIVDAPTSVQALNQSASSQPVVVYNLLGQRLDTPQHGVNIIGREKKMVK